MNLRTKKQSLYFDEVIRLHYDFGYGEDRISRILPIGHTTVSRWIAIFAAENKGKSVEMRKLKPSTEAPITDAQKKDIKALRAEVIRLQSELRMEKLRADAYDEMINVAESKLNISIRKKAGAKR